MAGIDVEALRRLLLSTEQALPTSRWGRLWRTGRGAAGLVRSTVFRGLERADPAAVAKVVERLGELRGIAMKAGQILGYADASLPDEVRSVLALLQTTAQATPIDEVRRTVRASLAPAEAEALLATLEHTPVAVASIGQVHRARLPDGTEVAVKVRHAGIEQALASDLGNADLGPLVARALVPHGALTVRAMVDEARAALTEECDYALEATRQQRFSELLAGHPVLRIPSVVRQFSGPAVLTTHWLPGQHLDAWLAGGPPQHLKDLAGVALFELYVGTLYRHGLFHADPHPGNYGFIPSGDTLTIAVYDFGCVRTFPPARPGEPSVAQGFSSLLLAVRADDPDAMERALRALGAAPEGDPATRALQRELLRVYFHPMLERGPHPVKASVGREAAALLDDKKAALRLNLPGRVLFLFRLRFGLYAVLERLGAVADWAALEGQWAEESAGLRPPA